MQPIDMQSTYPMTFGESGVFYLMLAIVLLFLIGIVKYIYDNKRTKLRRE